MFKSLIKATFIALLFLSSTCVINACADDHITIQGLYEIVKNMPSGSSLKIHVVGYTDNGEAVDKTVLLPMGEIGSDGKSRLKENAGLQLRQEQGAILIENFYFGSPAEQQGLDFDWQIVEVNNKSTTKRIPHSKIIKSGTTVLELEIGKSTISDVKDKYKIINKQKSIVEGVSIYNLDTSNINFNGLKRFDVYIDKNGKILEIELSIDTVYGKFEELLKILKGKYKLLQHKNPFPPQKKYGIFRDGDIGIYLVLDQNNPFNDIILRYLGDDFLTQLTKARKNKPKIKSLDSQL
jgi:hypothetical protein